MEPMVLLVHSRADGGGLFEIGDSLPGYYRRNPCIQGYCFQGCLCQREESYAFARLFGPEFVIESEGVRFEDL